MPLWKLFEVEYILFRFLCPGHIAVVLLYSDVVGQRSIKTMLTCCNNAYYMTSDYSLWKNQKNIIFIKPLF